MKYKFYKNLWAANISRKEKILLASRKKNRTERGDYFFFFFPGPFYFFVMLCDIKKKSDLPILKSPISRDFFRSNKKLTPNEFLFATTTAPRSLLNSIIFVFFSDTLISIVTKFRHMSSRVKSSI